MTMRAGFKPFDSIRSWFRPRTEVTEPRQQGGTGGVRESGLRDGFVPRRNRPVEINGAEGGTRLPAKPNWDRLFDRMERLLGPELTRGIMKLMSMSTSSTERPLLPPPGTTSGGL